MHERTKTRILDDSRIHMSHTAFSVHGGVGERESDV